MVLVVFALQEESCGHFDHHRLIHTGVGKVNAAYGLIKAIQEQKPKMVVNLGTAGSRKHPPGSIVNATHFVQRDMDVSFLGFDRYQTPFSIDPVTLDNGMTVGGISNIIQNGVCGTGDNFDTSNHAAQFDVVDMEAYALALICRRENIPFLCLKYVSDGADDQADQDWSAALERAAQALDNVLQKAL